MTNVSAELRQLVVTRANSCCEYCLLHQDDHYLSHEVDHIVALKHRGETTHSNLCLSCIDCNRYKGSDIGSFDLETQTFTGLYNPRTMRWREHFALNDGFIIPLTAEGRITEFLLRLNSDERITRRRGLILLNRYPCLAQETDFR